VMVEPLLPVSWVGPRRVALKVGLCVASPVEQGALTTVPAEAWRVQHLVPAI
jgi:hypothetical protein